MGLRNEITETYRGEMIVPFTLQEYRQRIQNVRKKMQEENIDLLYCTAPVSLYYLTGYTCGWYQGEEPTDWLPVGGIAIHASHDKMIYFDRSGHEPLTNTHILGDNIDIRIHSYKVQEETKLSELEFIIKNLKEEGWLRGTVGLEKMSHRPNALVAAMFDEALETEGCKVVNASEIVRQVRSIKSPQELNYHKTAGKLCDLGIRKAAEVIKPGMTEMEVMAEVQAAMTKAGSEYTGIPLSILSGPERTATGHSLISTRVIMPGDMILFDCCGVYKRYHTNTVRPISVGEPHSDVMKQIEIAGEAVNLLKSIIKPGLTARELSQTMVKYYKECGIWDDRRWLGGYEIGPQFFPSWIGSWVYNIVENCEDDRVFVSGNVMQHEAQFYLPRAAGMIWFIDTIAFDKEDAFLLTDLKPELIIAGEFDG